MRILPLVLLCAAFLPVVAQATPLSCDLSGYKPVEGIHATTADGALSITWQGESSAQLRAQFGIRDGQPVVEELAARSPSGQWVVLGKNLSPDFEVTTGKRRTSGGLVKLLKSLNMDTPEEENRRKWNVFWDAPLVVPGKNDPRDPPHLQEEIRRGSVSYQTTACKVISEGSRVSVNFNGLTLGIFSGSLQFTIYKGSNLLRQEAIASTQEPSVAYIYKAGLKGFAIADDTKLTWRDNAQVWQEYDFGGAPNNDPVNIRARNRLEIIDTGRGSLAVFPPPHKFFFARENEVNLGYVYYRKDSGATFSVGAMQPEQGEGYAPWGVTDEIWNKRVDTAYRQKENYALYNAPPGTEQRMAIYYYLSSKDSQATQQAVMAYTHNDVFKAVPGFKVVTGHFHMDFNEQLRDLKTLDYQPGWVPVFRGLGINIVYLGDFHDDSDPRDPGPKRLMEQKVYFEGTRRLSDKNFLIIPAEEVNSYLGGHWYLMMPKPVYFTHSGPRTNGQPFEENDPAYGHVYHLGSAEDVMTMVNQEQSILWTAHPRTKSSEVYPDNYKDKDFFLSDRFVGASWESLPVDLSQKRLCEIRCFGLNDEMSNWAPKPKYMLAEGDTYTKRPDDDTYPALAVNYLKLNRVPRYDESWAPVVEGIRSGNFFGTTGEILFHDWSIEGTGAKRTYKTTIEYTFPLDFAELVWSDGVHVDRQIIPLTDTTAFGTKTFNLPFDATHKKWIRFAVWDSAGNGAWLQPIALN